jgi:hypothetical protein
MPPLPPSSGAVGVVGSVGVVVGVGVVGSVVVVGAVEVVVPALVVGVVEVEVEVVSVLSVVGVAVGADSELAELEPPPLSLLAITTTAITRPTMTAIKQATNRRMLLCG